MATKLLLFISLTLTPPKVAVNLKDSNGLTLFSKRVKGTEGFTKMLNVNSLPNGVYFISVEDNEKITKQTFRIESNEVIIEENQKEIIQKPVFQYDTRRKRVSLNAVANGNIEVMMLSEFGNRLLQTSGVNQFEKVFNLKQLKQGTYTFIMLYDGETFYESISVR